MDQTVEEGSATRLIERLMTLHPKGYDLSLDRIERLMKRLGEPHRRMPPVIHIAGTNGKGSAAAFCLALLQEAGVKTHLHTSPHLVNWHERFLIAGPDGASQVSDRQLADVLARVETANRGEPITVFEILTAAMFVLFAENEAEAAIVEVGLGGRYDATNILPEPAVSLIMPISLDHEAWLGDRVELIAAEKAGIIKPERPVVIGFQPHDAARDVLLDTAQRLKSPVATYGDDFIAFAENGRLVYQDGDVLFDLSMPRLIGRHQYSNAAAAIAAVRMAGFDLGHGAVDRAMGKVRWPARMQKLNSGPLIDVAPKGAEIWLDGGHNPAAAAAIAEELASRGEMDDRPLFLIVGMINTKDQMEWFRHFTGLAKRVFTVPIDSSDAGVPNDELAAKAQAAGLPAEPIHSVENALRLLTETGSGEDSPPRIVICGSLYLAGEVLAANGTSTL